MRISDWSSDVCSSDLIYPIGYLSGGVSGGNGGAALVNPRPELLGVDLVGDRTFFFFALGWLAIVLALLIRQIGRASCRERVCQYVSISVVAVSLKKKK